MIWNRLWAQGAGIAQWLEHRTRDWKVAGSNPCWNGGRIFFSRVDFLCWLLFRYPFHPRVTTVARKKSRSFCQKCRWQVTAKTRIHLTYVAFIEPCFGIGHNLSLICQLTSEDIKHQLIITLSTGNKMLHTCYIPSKQAPCHYSPPPPQKKKNTKKPPHKQQKQNTTTTTKHTRQQHTQNVNKAFVILIFPLWRQTNLWCFDYCQLLSVSLHSLHAQTHTSHRGKHNPINVSTVFICFIITVWNGETKQSLDVTIVLISATKRKLEYVEGHLRNYKVRHMHQKKKKKKKFYNHLQSSTNTFLSRQILCNCFAIKLNIHRTNYFQCNKIYKAKVCVVLGLHVHCAHPHPHTHIPPLFSLNLSCKHMHTQYTVSQTV